MSSPDNELNQYLNDLADEDEREERIDALASEYAKDPAKRAEADEYLDGQMPEWWYANIEGVLADFAGSNLMEDIRATSPLVWRLAMAAAEARAEKIRDLAERDL